MSTPKQRAPRTAGPFSIECYMYALLEHASALSLSLFRFP